MLDCKWLAAAGLALLATAAVVGNAHAGSGGETASPNAFSAKDAGYVELAAKDAGYVELAAKDAGIEFAKDAAGFELAKDAGGMLELATDK